jgi:plastocyanin
VVQVVEAGFDSGRAPSIAVGSKGTISVSYLLVTPVPRPGVLPDVVVAGTSQPPSVMLATYDQGILNRVAVTGQPPVGKAVGQAPEIATGLGYAVPGVQTAIALDGSGKHYVAWSTPKGGVYYSTDAAGTFSAPVAITKDQAFGASIAIGPDGTPWVSFLRGLTLVVATGAGGKWQGQDVTRIGGEPGLPAVRTAIAIGKDGSPLVAYGDDGATVVAHRSGADWSFDRVPGAGGYGVSLALDKDGNPHVAYYDLQGGVHHAHSIGAAPWQVSDLGATAPGPAGKSDPRWGTGIAVDDQGVHSITWADTKANDIVYDTNASGAFVAQPLPSSNAGWTPALAASPDGKSVAISWFDSVNLNLDVATPASGQLVLAHPTPTLYQPSIPPPTAACSPSGTSLSLVAVNIAFDKNCLAAPAGTAFTIAFNNQDTGTPHNVEIFTNTSATTRLGGATGPTDIITGPATTTYSVEPLKAGSYYFRCDVHPQAMFGTFVVAKP